jgi:hypothetical protein
MPDTANLGLAGVVYRRDEMAATRGSAMPLARSLPITAFYEASTARHQN